jgi:hypothetical protein
MGRLNLAEIDQRHHPDRSRTAGVDVKRTLQTAVLSALSAPTDGFVSLFQIRRQHIFDPFHECADTARQVAPMRYYQGHGERPATKIGYDLHKRSTL